MAEAFSCAWLLEHVEPEPNSGCWLWTKGSNGRSDAHRYGRFRYMGRLTLAHRAFYEHYRAPLARGAHVLHRCDNPACVNPEHLQAGTNLDNIRDKVAKGRQARGDVVAHRGEAHWMKRHPERIARGATHPRRRLTPKQEAQVTLALQRGETVSSVAREFKVSRTVINRIKGR